MWWIFTSCKRKVQIRTMDVWKSDFVGPSFHFSLRFQRSIWYETLRNSGIEPPNFQIILKYNQHTSKFTKIFFRITIKECFPSFNGHILFVKVKKDIQNFSPFKKAKQNKKPKPYSSHNMVEKFIKYNDKYYAWKGIVWATGKILLSKDVVGCRIISMAW